MEKILNFERLTILGLSSHSNDQEVLIDTTAGEVASDNTSCEPKMKERIQICKNDELQPVIFP